MGEEQEEEIWDEEGGSEVGWTSPVHFFPAGFLSALLNSSEASFGYPFRQRLPQEVKSS